MVIHKPTVATYGASHGEYGGNLITHYTPSGDINPDKLNKNNLADTLEFNEFERDIHDFVLARLGHPIVRVELSPFQIKTVIDESITKLYYRCPMWTKQFAVFNASAGVNIYELPQYIAQNLEYVVYKKTLLTIQSQAGTLEFDFFIKYFQDNHLFSDFSVAEFYLLQQWLEQIRKILSQEGTWDVLDGRYLQISPTPAITPQEVILEYRALNSNTIHPAYKLWIQKYALATAKILLGEIRGKFAVLPSPGGGASLNGDRLVQEGLQEQERLEEQLRLEIEEPPIFTTF